mgnify:CR=1 FL=1
MPSSRKEEPWLPFKISRSVSRNRTRNAPNSKQRTLEKKIRERNRKWRSLVTHSAGESVLSAVGCAWQELDLDALDRFLASHADEVSDMLTAHGSTPEDAKARLDARKKKTVKTEPVAGGGLQAAEPDSENSDW